MKKEITVFITAFVLAAGFCSCSPGSVISEGSSEASPDLEAVRTSFDKASAYIESAVDTSSMTVITEDEDSRNLTRSWSYDEPENITLSDVVEIDGNKIIIGETTEKELENLNLKAEKSKDTAEPDESVSVTLTNEDDKSMILSIQSNDTDATQTVGDLPVYGFKSGLIEYTLPFNYSGLTGESDLEDALKIFGAPNTMIYLSANDLNTSIELEYLNEKKEQDFVITDDLLLVFKYNEDDTTELTCINYSREKYPANARD